MYNIARMRTRNYSLIKARDKQPAIQRFVQLFADQISVIIHMANPTLPDLSDLKASYFAPKNVMPCLDVEESYLNASSWSEEFDKLLKSKFLIIEINTT